MMKINVIGIRGEVPEIGELKDTAYASLELVIGEYSVIFDLADERSLELIKAVPLALFITHLHKDHFAKEVINAFQQRFPKAEIYIPHRVLKSKWKEETAQIKFKKIAIEETVEIASLKITAFPVVHSILAPTVGYRIENEQNLLYLPDFLWVDREYTKYLENVDIAIVGASSFAKNIVRIPKNFPNLRIGHISMKSALKLAKKNEWKQVYFTHYGRLEGRKFNDIETDLRKEFPNLKLLRQNEEIKLKEIDTIILQKKFDGALLALHKSEKKVLAYTERGFEVSHRLPFLTKELLAFKNPKRFVVMIEMENWKGGVHRGREFAGSYLMEKGAPDDRFFAFHVWDIVYFWDDELVHHELQLTRGDIHDLPLIDRLRYLRLIPFKQSTNGVPDLKKSLLNLVPSQMIETSEELDEAIQNMMKQPACEGIMIKDPNHKFQLDMVSNEIWKAKVYVEIHAIVYDRYETKVKGVYNYGIALRFEPDDKIDEQTIIKIKDKEYTKIGRSYATKEKLEPGTIVEIHAHNFGYYITKEDKRRINLYEPVFAGSRPEQNIPDSVKEAYKIAERGLALKIKEEQVEFQQFVSAEEIDMEDPYLLVPYREEGGVEYVVQLHIRGRSSHKDLRIELTKDVLVGWTLTDAIRGAIKQPITTLEEAENIAYDPKLFKIDWNTGLPHFRRRIVKGKLTAPVFAEITAIKKAVEPPEWKDFQGVTPVGAVGATATHPGVFYIVDGTPKFRKAKAWHGSKKPYFSEWFFRGGKLKGRYFVRRLRFPERRPAEASDEFDTYIQEALNSIDTERETEFFLPIDGTDFERIILPPPTIGEEETGYLFIKPLDETCYTLSKAAVDKDYLPTLGFSALPDWVREQIPTEFHYWKKTATSEAVAVRNKLVDLIRKGEIKIEFEFPELKELKKKLGLTLTEEFYKFEEEKFEPFKAELTFQWQWFKGRKLIRPGVSREHWDLRIDFGSEKKDRYFHLVLELDPRFNPVVHGYMKKMKNPEEAMVKGGTEKEPEYLPPSTIWNPTKATPSFIVIYLKRHPITVFIRRPDFIKFEIDSKELKGLFTITRENMTDFWILERTKTIGQENFTKTEELLLTK